MKILILMSLLLSIPYLGLEAKSFEVQNEECQIRAQVEQAVENGSENSGTERVFVLVRLSCNSLGIAYGLHAITGFPLKESLVVGVFGGLLSALQQLVHAELVSWQANSGVIPMGSQLMSNPLARFLQLKKEKKAGIIEAAVKEYSLHVLYLGLLRVAQATYGLKDTFFSNQVLSTSLLSLFSDGLLNLANVKATDSRIERLTRRLIEQAETRDLTIADFQELETKVRRTFTWSKAAAVGISFSATVLALMDMEGVAWAAPILQIMGLGGGIASLALFKEEIKGKLCSLRLRFLPSKNL